ncbi:hypothetical protein BH09BAC1_BH09BAC1_04020 [soil metagenome]
MKNLIFFIALMGLSYYLFGYMLKDMDVTASAINFEKEQLARGTG